MDRRRFLTRSGALLAGSAWAGIAGCSDVYIPLPCMGPAAPPVPVPGMSYIRASEIGCALDCDLFTGRNKHHGGLATDDGPRINAAMAGASASNPITLILDGSALISGLFLPSGGHWGIAGLGCGTGFFIQSGTNNDGIHNGGPKAAIPFDPGPPAPQRGSNVTLSNFTINGNRGNGHDGVSTTGSPQGGMNTQAGAWYCAINLMSLDNIQITNVVVVDAPSYHMRLSNVGHVDISGCILRSEGPNTDGFHFDGPSNDVSISNCEITSGDDAIALNCPEGYTGDISRVSVSNCQVNSGSFLMRLHSVDDATGKKGRIDTVSVSGCSGSCTYAGFLVGHGVTAGPRSIDNVTILSCNLSAPAFLEIGANFGSVVLENNLLTPSASHLFPGFALARSSGYSNGCSYAGGSLEIRNCSVNRNNSLQVPALSLANRSTLGNLQFDGFSLADPGGHAKTTELIAIVSGTLGELTLNAVDSSHIAAALSQGGAAGVGEVGGAGVLATGWEFPDPVMADDVPYISATTGLPSIKINGVVEPYHS